MPTNQTIPITLTWGPVAPGFQAGDINELGQLLARQLAGAMRADVSFIQQTLIDPTTYATDLIFNITQGVFKAWSSTEGRYIPVSQFAIGDVKNSFVGTDTVATGWVVLNGRAISAIPGLSTAQQQTLETFFPGGSLPTVHPHNQSGLPPVGSFSNIPSAPILPAEGVIAALSIGAAYDQTEIEVLRNSTETVRNSTAAVDFQVAAMKNISEGLLGALHNNPTPSLYSLMFIGFA